MFSNPRQYSINYVVILTSVYSLLFTIHLFAYLSERK